MTETETPETEWAELSAEKLQAMTVAELRALVNVAGIDVPKSAPKAALVEAIEEYRARVRESVDAMVERAVTTEEIEGEAVEETDEEIESTALALREEPVVQEAALLPTTSEFDAMLAISTKIANTQMVPTAYRGKPDDVLAAILTGREMELGPMQSLREIYVIDGKPSLSANLLLARMRSGGLIIEESESTAERAWARVRNRATGEVVEEEWTIEEARVAKTRERGQTIALADKNTFRNYPKDMLWARLVGRIARRFPDLIGAVMPYSSEEVQDWESDAPADSGARPHGDDSRTGTWISPTTWGELVARISSDLVLGGDAAAWMEELAEKAYRHPSIKSLLDDAEIPDDKKRDLFRRLLGVLRTLEDAGVDPFGVASLPDPRRAIQEAIAAAFDGALALEGPAWALAAAEAEAGRPSRDGKPSEAVGAAESAETAPATETSTETSEAASGPEAAAEKADPAPGMKPVDEIHF